MREFDFELFLIFDCSGSVDGCSLFGVLFAGLSTVLLFRWRRQRGLGRSNR